jgi:hypothetical protein
MAAIPFFGLPEADNPAREKKKAPADAGAS